MANGRLIYVKGNVLEPQKFDKNELVIIPHCCNNLGKMGAGVALSLLNKWPLVWNTYKKMEAESTSGLKNRLGEINWVQVENDIVVVNMIAQDGLINKATNPRPVKYWALLKCMQEALKYAGNLCAGYKFVFHCPQFGSKLAGGDWHVIETLIREAWCERGFDVVIYDFEPDRDKWGAIEQKKDVVLEKNTSDKYANSLEGMAEAFSIMGKYTNDYRDFCAEHDVIYAGGGIDIEKVSAEDIARLEELRWDVNEEGEGFIRYC